MHQSHPFTFQLLVANFMFSNIIEKEDCVDYNLKYLFYFPGFVN